MNKNNFRLILVAFILAFTIIPFGFSTYQIINNGSFETGDSTDWGNIINSPTATISYPLTPDVNVYATDGNFYLKVLYPAFSNFNSGSGFLHCSTSKVISANTTYDINTAFGCRVYLNNYCYLRNVSVMFKNILDSNVTGQPTLLLKSSNPLLPFKMGYFSGTLTNTFSSDAYICFYLSNGNIATSGNIIEYGFDDLKVNKYGVLTNSLTSSSQPASILSPFNIYVGVVDNFGNNITDANVKLRFNDDANVTLSYDSSIGKYIYTNSGLGQGIYSYSVYTTKTGYTGDTDTGTFQVNVNPTSLNVSCISNCSVTSKPTTIYLGAVNDVDEVVFKVLNQSGYSVTANYSWNNAQSNKQYFVYTSSNGSSWAFDESLTYGSSLSYNDPVQKVWSGSTYTYNFSDSLVVQGVYKYYKLVPKQAPAFWKTIYSSSDWVNVNQPESYTDSNNYNWDLFNDSNYTNILSYTVKNYPQLTSSDMNTGFEVQFTAYSSADTNIKVGYRLNNGNNVTLLIPVTPTTKRFSVPVALVDWNSVLVITSSSTTSARVYLSDYAIIPRSYFNSRLEISQVGDFSLDSIVRSSVSYEYLKEGTPFKFKTGAFDKDGDLKTLRIEAMIGSVAIKTYGFNLTDAVVSNGVYNWNETLEGVIDLNGTAFNLNTLEPLRDFTLKATLINTSNKSVAEQYKTIKLLQYPFFQTDFYQNISTVNKKVGTNPKINYTIHQINPDVFIGVDVAIYDSSHSITNPNFSKTIYANELGCSTLAYCQKTITFNEYSYESATNYSIRFTALLKTENKSYTNFLTTTVQNLVTTEGTLETARLFQVFERRDTGDSNKTKYTNSEEIPLVLQVRDDTCKNLENEIKPYIKITTYDGVTASPQGAGFFPQKFIYDQQTCYNYWLWNNLFYMDDGSLLPDGNTVRFVAYMAKPLSTHTTSGYTLADKCSGYPSDFFKGSLIMNWLGFAGDLLFGCTDPTDPVQDYLTTSQEKFITIDNAYTPSALQNESVFCVRTDVNKSYKSNLGDEFVCGVLFLKSEQQIDGFKVMIGNSYSNYAINSESEKQYISFEIPAEDIIFNDVLLLRSALATEFNTNKINTIGQLLSAGVNKLLPYGQGLVDFTTDQLNSGVWIQNAGADINLSEQLNPNKVSGLYFFKVSGLQVINQYDYIADYPELETINPSMFRGFMNAKGARLLKKQATVKIYSNSFDNFNSFKVDSPLVIYEKPSGYKNSTDLDSNNLTTVIPSMLKFDFIVDMYSNNQQAVQRAYVPIVFTYFVPQSYSWGNIMKGFSDFMADPAGSTGKFMADNWFGLLMLLILAIVVSLIYANIKGGGKININLGNRRDY